MQVKIFALWTVFFSLAASLPPTTESKAGHDVASMYILTVVRLSVG